MDKLKQVTASIFVVLALFVASVSACACAHHHHEPVKLKAEIVPQAPSCHSMAMEESSESAHHADTINAPEAQSSIESVTGHTADASCECILQPSNQLVIKTEKLALDQHVAVAAEIQQLPLPVAVVVAVPSNNFYSLQIFISDAEHTLKPGRAPPRL